MINDIKDNFKAFLQLTLIMSFPLFFVIILGCFIIPFQLEYLREVIAFGLLTSIFVGFVLLTNNLKLRIFLLTLCNILLALFAFVKLSFYINYSSKISASALFVIFETNSTEASDFLNHYFSVNIIILYILLLISAITSIWIFHKKKFKFKRLLFSTRVALVFMICILSFCVFKKLQNENLLLTSLYSYKDYCIAKANLKLELAKQKTENINNILGKDEQQTYVIIIGESTSKWHMQLYGYERETNPLLSEIKDDLLVFEDVITSNVHTILALDKILTLSDYNEPNKFKNASIIQLANNAGFETFWISNQKPVGIHESIPTIIGTAAKHTTFIATNNSSYNIYDESLFPYFENALNKVSKKKIIFLHLIGAHSSYNRRYPKSYNVFSGFNNTIFKHPKSKKLINEYDNAILYNDFVVRKIIETVKAKNDNSYVVYFSDHGDEVYDTFDFVGHNEYHGSRAMYEVPFIAWFSKKYKQKNKMLFNVKNVTQRPYILEDFIHSFSEISNISFDKYNATKSIFSSFFKKKQRLIKKGEDYDAR